MATTAARVINITYTIDTIGQEAIPAASNAASPGSVTMHTLASGANTITAPTGGSVLAGATIVPPANNTQTLTLKGVTGDTGVLLHKTDPTSIALDSSVTTFCLTAGNTITGLKIYWT